ncbi:MAG: HAD family hydrolase [bacterium]|nr:HAD family hydrolase [bacterium]
MITTVLFDLDGTLLPMDQDEFAGAYFKELIKKVAPLGYDPKKLVGDIWAGTAAMVMNDGSCTNEEAFWKKFVSIYGEKCLKDRPIFDEYYRNEFNNVQSSCGFNAKAAEAVRHIKESGYRAALATNPIFPGDATRNRIKWAGLNPEDFELYTTYENMNYCKPNPKYYLDVTEKLNVKPEECLMVGNDVTEDMVAATLGMKVFLLTDCIINKENSDISSYPQGGFNELIKFIDSL